MSGVSNVDSIETPKVKNQLGKPHLLPAIKMPESNVNSLIEQSNAVIYNT